MDPVIQTTLESPTKRIQLSDIAMAKSAPTREEEDDKKKDLWWIHGNGYDLQGLVERHPGGKEAILLGKGRDCTALVESYHAFSSHHRKVLEKYLRQPVQNPPPPDHFYEVLKQRSAAALKAKGIDPVKDRGAGWLRMTYYFIISCFVLATGYWHVKVSDTIGFLQALHLSPRLNAGSFCLETHYV
jgi:cytochrome b involved in lipid metabolism